MKKSMVFITVMLICVLTVTAQDMFQVRRLTTDPAQEGFPSWSPDGKSIIYQRSQMGDTSGKNGLWKVSLDDGGALQIFSGIAEHPRWSPDGRLIVFDADTGSSIKMIPAEGGDLILFLPDSIHIKNGGLPHWSPDGSRIAFIEGKRLSICIYDLATGSIESIFRKEGMLPLIGGWLKDGNSLLIGLMDMQSRRSTIRKISLEGEMDEQISGHHENFYRYLALSPDESLLIYAALVENRLGLYIMSASGGKTLPLSTSPEAHNEGPIWSPDGSKIAFNSTRGYNADIWIMDMDIKKLKNQIKELNK